MTEAEFDQLMDRAYAASGAGRLHEASRHFAALLEARPDSHNFHYMRGLVHKYLRDWPTSLQHNLRAVETAKEPDQASQWNAGIAATALGDWATARRQWIAAGIRLPEGDGPIDSDFGLASVRLNPWSDGETVFARRVDVVRARLLNVPLPESGYRFGDIVLHDGAPTGRRATGGTTVPVFNVLQRLAPSDFRTFTAFVRCDTPAARDELLAMSLPGIGYLEDWTDSIVRYCLRCSHGTPHSHDKGGDGAWQSDRNLGIAAQSRAAVDRLLENWKAAGKGRQVDGVESREHAVPVPEDGQVWWRGPEDDEQNDGD
ncbi:MAG: hypothetical protein EOP91_07100 [Lysobacteraceae bacterium]|nr:MAG: hypothetical protein EOP91_07100 [Xanthomonadaceae bacterium]